MAIFSTRPGLLQPAADPVDVGGLHAVFVLQDRARPDIGGELIFGDADLAALQVRGLLDAVGAHIDRGVAERARHEGRHAHIGEVALRGLHRGARQRQLADVELGMAERAEEDLLRVERHEHRIDAVDLHGAVGERAGAVIVAHRDGETEFRHVMSGLASRAETAAAWPPLADQRTLSVSARIKRRDAQLQPNTSADDARVPVDRLLVVLLAQVGRLALLADERWSPP